MEMPNATLPGLEGGKGSWTIAVTTQIEEKTAGKVGVSTEPCRKGSNP